MKRIKKSKKISIKIRPIKIMSFNILAPELLEAFWNPSYQLKKPTKKELQTILKKKRENIITIIGNVSKKCSAAISISKNNHRIRNTVEKACNQKNAELKFTSALSNKGWLLIARTIAIPLLDSFQVNSDSFLRWI